MSSTPFRIIIVGGGIAGMAAAIALRAPGRDITILEQSRLNTEIGATLSLQPNATRILQETWGLKNLLKDSQGTVDQGFRIYNVEGKLVNEVKLSQKTEYGADRVVWHRQDLHEYLKRAATSLDLKGKPCTVRTSSRVVACEPELGIVTLEDGAKLEADVIIGADGIHSVIRPTVLGRQAKAIPTGSSAYRLMISTKELEENAPEFCRNIDPRSPFTSMVMAHECRLIMGPARGGELYSLVGLVPDEKMNEDPDAAQSWVTKGDRAKMLETFDAFPEWTKSVLKLGDNIGLWQLRDLDPLETWTRGRVILIGDAAHAMLPTQGQGASQTIEDAEALGAFFHDIQHIPDLGEIATILQDVFRCRFERASLIQKYSREAAKPPTAKGSNEIRMKPDEFMDYNCFYRGAKEWKKTQNLVSPA
ncbi:FAD binding domain-containing protein [Aaosphaeria arxii CBS 175.79]|uniref:FAD binding domain-containing protein n=1 Tax=Aaosphaeria arxii CBS 175.79 TaxID=1450172 RepID=A0A6A5XMW0_9PLEO|nr:FAD binding domain-containing protein [Aaosphaeria arxii CBS 175.79]KAF2014452.1 FAD binding domain-containing protein [Aaosphaeria arxii CBS 175.79]